MAHLVPDNVLDDFVRGNRPHTDHASLRRHRILEKDARAQTNTHTHHESIKNVRPCRTPFEIFNLHVFSHDRNRLIVDRDITRCHLALQT